jgi:hypothetical protein
MWINFLLLLCLDLNLFVGLCSLCLIYCQSFYDEFLCDKFYLIVCTRNFDNFFYDKCTCAKASMLAFELTSALVIKKIVKVLILFVYIWVNKENLSK